MYLGSQGWGIVMFGGMMPIGVVETWESAPTLCTDEAVGSLERGRVVNDYLWRSRLGTHIDCLA